MKTFYVSRERLDSLIDKLWEKGEELGLRISLAPSEQTLRLFKDNDCIAAVTLLDVVDEYDIVADLF